MDQLQLPLSFDEIIPENHLVRVVNTIVDSLNLDPLYDRYKTGGNKPDFRTVNRFRSDMKDIIDDVFYDVVRLLIDRKYISMENCFLDGTKIEANANKYTFVWNKAVKRYDSKLNEEERITSEQVEAVVESIEKRLDETPDDKTLKKELGSYVKYNKFHWEKKKKNREDTFLTQNFPYDKETDSFICPEGKRIVHNGNRKYITDAGYETRRDYYRCNDCAGCPSAELCKNTEGAKIIRYSHRLEELKKKANENLCSEEGKRLRSQRVVEVEQTFGRIKGCWSFRRFHLRGKEKVKIEWGLPAIAHNISKMALER